MIRNWFIVGGLAIIILSTATGLAIHSTPSDVANGPPVAAFKVGESISGSKAQNEKHDVNEKGTSPPSDSTNRRLRRNVAAVGDNMDSARSVDDAARRIISNDETEKISARLPPNADRFNLFPFDYNDFNYRRGESDKLALVIRRLESLITADELRRLAASNGDNGESGSATSNARTRHHYDGSFRAESASSDPGNEFEYVADDMGERDVEERQPQDAGWERRQQRSFDSLGGGLLPIKKQFDTLGGGIIPISRKSSSDHRSEPLGRSLVGEEVEGVDRWLESTKKQFDTLGGGMLPIKRRSQYSKLVAKNLNDEDRSLSTQRRNFDTLGGGLLPI